MDTDQIDSFGSRFYASNWLGVYALDEFERACGEIKPKVKNGSFFIVNTDPSSKPGTHWVLVSFIRQYLKDGREQIFIFDSFGKNSVLTLLKLAAGDSNGSGGGAENFPYRVRCLKRAKKYENGNFDY